MKKGFIAILILLCLLLGGAFAAIYVTADHEGPDITFGSDETVYTDDTTSEELLTDVKALDGKDGDVTASLTVDTVFLDEDNQTATVVYAAKDSANNVTKVQRKLKYAEQADEKTKSDDPEKDTEDEEKEESKSDQVQQESSPTPAETEVPELSEEEQLAQANDVKIAALPATAPKFYLTQYLVKIKTGETVDSLSYVKEITDDTDSSEQLWRQIQLKGEYDRNTPGTYEQVFYVMDSSGNQSNEAVLRIIVE